MKSRKNKKYKPKINPVILAKKIESQEKKIEGIKLLDELKYNSLENYIQLVINFASHDIKNALHNMDGVLSTMDLPNFTEQDLATLKECIRNIRESWNEFTNLSSPPTGAEKESFEILRLMTSLETLHRASFKQKKIVYSSEYLNIAKNFRLFQKFQQVVQIFNNMLINCLTALESSDEKKISISVENNGENCLKFLVCDTGCGVLNENKEKIFTPYFSTKGSSGVGLTHVQTTLKSIGGNIKLLPPNAEFVTIFEVQIPINETLDPNN